MVGHVPTGLRAVCAPFASALVAAGLAWLAVAADPAAAARERAPASGNRGEAAAAAGPPNFVIDARAAGPVMSVDFIGNASRLDTLLAVKSGSALQGGKGGPTADFFRAVYPNFRHFRIGNTFFGYQCAGLDFDEMAVRGDGGRIEYRFEQTLTMLQMVLAAGIKPHLALAGTPLALVPAGEEVIKHRTYGCVNAPRIDWSKTEPRDRTPEWWALQDAFMTALIARFGIAEVQQWTFATWSEPMNEKRKLAHLVLPKDVVQSGRHDAGVAAVAAASIDVAMKHKLRIRIGNLAGRVEEEYPSLVREIGRFPRGKEYLAYIDGYAISRYRSQPRRGIDQALEAAFGLLANPAMPAKPLYIDELGDLSGTDGAEPFGPAAGLAGAQFTASALERVFSRQDGTARSPKGVAFWRDQIAPRGRDIFTDPQSYLKTPTTHVIDMFASFNGFTRLTVAGPAQQALAGGDRGRVKAILLPAGPPDAKLKGPPAPQTRTVTVRGLRPDANYEVTLTEISRVRGNPISAFLDGAPGYMQDTKGRFAVAEGKWKLASTYWESCYFDENAACAWRHKAREIEAPLVRGSKIRTDRSGVLSTSMVVDEAGIVMVDIAPLK